MGTPDTAAERGRLTAEQVRQFQDEGYVLPSQAVFSPAKFQALKDHFEQKLIAWEQTSGKSPEHMDTPHFTDTTLFDWLLDEAVLDLVEPLIGPDIALFSSHFICKPAGKGKRVPWHEDSGYWKGRLEPMEVVTIWLAIDPSTPDNGCMRVVPGTHVNGFSEYEDVNDPGKEVFPTEIKGADRFEQQAVDCVLEPNQCSIHHAKCIHGSHANTGNQRRCGYTMRYMPTTAKLVDDKRNENFQIYLARGRDRAGNRYADPSKPNPAFT